MNFDKPSAELDLAVAEAAGIPAKIVFGRCYRTRVGLLKEESVIYSPSSDMTDAWEAAEKIGLFDPDGFAANLCQVDTPKGKQWCIDWPGTDVGFEVQAATGPLALCAAIIGTQKGKTDV